MLKNTHAQGLVQLQFMGLIHEPHQPACSPLFCLVWLLIQLFSFIFFFLSSSSYYFYLLLFFLSSFFFLIFHSLFVALSSALPTLSSFMHAQFMSSPCSKMSFLILLLLCFLFLPLVSKSVGFFVPTILLFSIIIISWLFQSDFYPQHSLKAASFSSVSTHR